jgi:molybdate transport system ATP-binding protein
VPDWGIDFESGKVPEGVSHIGIRANHIVSASAAKREDVAVSFPFEVASEIEDTFTYILMVRKRGTELPVIRWEIPKKERAALREMPQELAFLREHILYLRQEG